MKYFVIEGIDKSGKSTQHKLLQKELQKRNIDSNYLFVNEPGGSAFGEKIKDIILNQNLNLSKRANFFLFLAQRAQLIETISKEKRTIISDRSLVSGIAYANDLSLKQALKLNLLATNYIIPQKIVFLEINKEILQARLKNKTRDNIEKNGIDYLLSIQDRFKKVLQLLESDTLLKAFKNAHGLKSPEVLYLHTSNNRYKLKKEIFNFLIKNQLKAKAINPL